MPQTEQLPTLRRQLRGARSALSVRTRRTAARRVAVWLRRCPAVRNARRLGAYRAVRGELDLGPFLAGARARGTHVFLPQVRGQRLRFARHQRGDRLVPGRFGIAEPGPVAARVAVGALQVVLAPLLAFDGAGNRLGSGGGFYDRALAARGAPRGARRPLIIGVAYAFQAVSALPAQTHDVALDAVVTPDGLHVFRRRA
jgi:5-formyltetrahydrofolate cyclo-ligase